MSPENAHDTTTPRSGETHPEGLILYGQYLSTKTQEGRPRDASKPDGERWPDREIVTVLVGDRTYQVEYRDADAARAAVGNVQPTQPIALPVGTRAGGKYVFYYGRQGR